MSLRYTALIPQAIAGEPKSYSPQRAELPSQLLWGDTHLHTTYSPDAFSMGNVALTPEQAYAFARGEAVVASNGMTARLNRPLDFLVRRLGHREQSCRHL